MTSGHCAHFVTETLRSKGPGSSACEYRISVLEVDLVVRMQSERSEAQRIAWRLPQT